jgi:hypothetical protein
LIDDLDDAVGIAGCRDAERDLIPHPLPFGGEVEVLAFDSKAIDD